ncbi:MAG: BatD family protein [Candidatus Latescibacterota bacterium]|nr:BatD family protein [Candidatus Latescibacterota bacterium]
MRISANFWMIFLLVSPVVAQEIQFEASVDRTRISQSEPIRYSLRIISDENMSHVPSPVLSMDGFHVEGPSVSTRMEMINFNTSFTRELTYLLYAKKAGNFRIEPAEIILGGEIYKTRSIDIEVGQVQQRQARSTGANKGFDINEHLYLRVNIDRKKVFVGQQLNVDFDLFYRHQLYNVGFKEIPGFSGFWNKELWVAKQLEPHRQVVEGISFNVAPLRVMALFPTRAGVHHIEPMTITCDIPARRTSRGNMLDNFFSSDPFGRSQSILIQSDSLSIDVMSLPERGRPVFFTGVVGHFNLSAIITPNQVRVGDPVTLRIEISGEGNFAAIKGVDLDTPEGVKLYDPTIEEEETLVKRRYGGRRTYEYILIPQRVGILKVPPVKFAYFNPDLEEYITLKSDTMFVRCEEGDMQEENENVYSLKRADIERVGRDIRYIKPDLNQWMVPTVFYESQLFWLAQIFVPISFGILFGVNKHRQRLQGDLAYARRRRARGEALKQLEHVDKLLLSGDSNVYYAGVQHTLKEFLGDRFNVPSAGMTAEDCVRFLTNAEVPTELIEETRLLFSLCDDARFAQKKVSIQEMKRVRIQLEELIESLEQQV